jgi:hypothetical protein
MVCHEHTREIPYPFEMPTESRRTTLPRERSRNLSHRGDGYPR